MFTIFNQFYLHQLNVLDDLVLDVGLVEVPGWLANAVKIVGVDPIVQ